MNAHPDEFAALIPTCKRSALLERALRSVFDQHRPADGIVVVDDPDCRSASAEVSRIVERLRKQGHACDLLANRRIRARAGALNSGSDHIAHHVADASGMWVGLLDADEQCIGPGY